MDEFVPYDKMSKKKQKELNAQRRGDWGNLNPVTRTTKNKKAYNRRKARRIDDEFNFVPFTIMVWKGVICIRKQIWMIKINSDKVLLCIDADKGIFEGYSMGSSFNGWQCPFFPKAVADFINSSYDSKTSRMNYLDESDTFIVDYEDGTQSEYKGEDCLVNGEIKHLYPIGNFEWTWHLATESEIEEHCDKIFREDELSDVEYIPFGDDCEITKPSGAIDASDLNFFDDLEYDCMELVGKYANAFGLQIRSVDSDETPISFDIAKEVQGKIFEIFENYGIAINFDPEQSEALESAIGSDPITKEYYFPLLLQMEDRDYELEEVDDVDLTDYEDEIREALKNEQSEGNMANYFGRSKTAEAKLKSAIWDVENLRGELFGKVTAILSENFTPEEEKIFVGWISGQNSDGLGEGFEQRPVSTDIGDMYISMWDSSDNYKITPADDMDPYYMADKMNSGINM